MTQIKTLLNLLDENIRLYERMAAVCLKERAFVEEGKIEKLGKVAEVKENITFKLKVIDDQRRGVLAKISHDLGLAYQPMTLRDLAKRREYKSLKTDILEIRDRLNYAMLEVRKLNSFNAKLLGSAASVIKRTITSILRPEAGATTYFGNKVVEKSSGRSSMLRRAL